MIKSFLNAGACSGTGGGGLRHMMRVSTRVSQPTRLKGSHTTARLCSLKQGTTSDRQTCRRLSEWRSSRVSGVLQCAAKKTSRALFGFSETTKITLSYPLFAENIRELA